MGGHNSWETLVNLEFRALDLAPDLVILYQNTNDVHARIVPPSAYRGDNSGRRRPWDAELVGRTTSWSTRIPSVLWRFAGINLGWLDVSSYNLTNVVSNPCTGPGAGNECFGGMRPSEVLDANPPIYYERNMRNIVAVAQANNVSVLLLTWAYNPRLGGYSDRPEYQAAFAEHNEIVRHLSNELNTYFYDFASAMPLDTEYWADGRHMTVEGNRVRAELIAAYLDEAGIVPAP